MNSSCFDCLQLRVELRETRGIIEQINGRLQQQNSRLDRLENRFDSIDRKLSFILNCFGGSNSGTKISPSAGSIKNDSQHQKNSPIFVSAIPNSDIQTPTTATVISIPISIPISSPQDSPQNSLDPKTPNSAKRVEVESAIATEPFMPSRDQFVHIAELKQEPIDEVITYFCIKTVISNVKFASNFQN